MMRFLEKRRALQIVGLVLIVAACLTLPAYFIYQSAKGLIIEELNKNALNIAATAASFIEQDIEAYRSLPFGNDADPESFDQEYYDMLLERLERIRHESGAARVFTEKRLPDKSSAFMLPPPLPDRSTDSDTVRSLTPAEHKVFNEGVMTPSGLMRDKTRGEFIAGYAPIIDSETGETIGIVGVEFTLAYAWNLTSGIRNIIIFTFLVIIVLMSIVVYGLIESRTKYFKEDYLTGLSSKRFFERDLKRAVRYVKRTEKKLSLLMIDVDGFKTINDTLGHAFGDTVLKSVADRMQKHIRKKDLCSRYGGDEFIITLADTNKAEAFEIAERIRGDISEMTLCPETGESVRISLSIGIAEFCDCQSAEKLIECADMAMYISKNMGKNKTTVYDSHMAA